MHDLLLLKTIAAGFAAAWFLGLITQALKLSPIVGYLLAGIVIGPYTPGFKGDIDIAGQLAEIGVILMMFGVGLHFHLKDLIAVKWIAIPGAIGQSLIATLAAMGVFALFGWDLKSGVMLGMAMAVASTVVLLRGLMDRDMLNSVHGHVAVGWLIVEDIFTVLLLVLVPVLAGSVADVNVMDAAHGAETAATAATHSAVVIPASDGLGLAALGWALAKLAALVVILLLAGWRVVPWMLLQVARLRSQELFTLTVLVLSIAIAVASAEFFGASMALGAFLAGMVVAQSPVSHQAAADVLPLRDAFAVLFFVSVGMFFKPMFLLEQPLMVAAGVGIVLIAKPIAALFIVVLLGYSARTALTVAVGLSQIGEFSFILSQVAQQHRLMSEDGHNVLIATAIISITINPLLFSSIDRIEGWLKNRPALWKLLNKRADAKMHAINIGAQEKIAAASEPKQLAIIVGYGPVGRVVDALLRDAGLHTVIVDTNMDTVQSLTKSGRTAIFGDATRPEVLQQAGIERAGHLILTLPHSSNRGPLVMAARQLNEEIEITVRARYLGEKETLVNAGANRVIYEEGESGVALARHIMQRRGVDDATIKQLLAAIRRVWGMEEDATRKKTQQLGSSA